MSRLIYCWCLFPCYLKRMCLIHNCVKKKLAICNISAIVLSKFKWKTHYWYDYWFWKSCSCDTTALRNVSLIICVTNIRKKRDLHQEKRQNWNNHIFLFKLKHPTEWQLPFGVPRRPLGHTCPMGRYLVFRQSSQSKGVSNETLNEATACIMVKKPIKLEKSIAPNMADGGFPANLSYDSGNQKLVISEDICHVILELYKLHWCFVML